jgi:hypothetical protein
MNVSIIQSSSHKFTIMINTTAIFHIGLGLAEVQGIYSLNILTLEIVTIPHFLPVFHKALSLLGQ